MATRARLQASNQAFEDSLQATSQQDQTDDDGEINYFEIQSTTLPAGSPLWLPNRNAPSKQFTPYPSSLDHATANRAGRYVTSKVVPVSYLQLSGEHDATYQVTNCPNESGTDAIVIHKSRREAPDEWVSFQSIGGHRGKVRLWCSSAATSNNAGFLSDCVLRGGEGVEVAFVPDDGDRLFMRDLKGDELSKAFTARSIWSASQQVSRHQRDDPNVHGPEGQPTMGHG